MLHQSDANLQQNLSYTSTYSTHAADSAHTLDSERRRNWHCPLSPMADTSGIPQGATSLWTPLEPFRPGFHLLQMFPCTEWEATVPRFCSRLIFCLNWRDPFPNVRSILLRLFSLFLDSRHRSLPPRFHSTRFPPFVTVAGRGGGCGWLTCDDLQWLIDKPGSGPQVLPGVAVLARDDRRRPGPLHPGVLIRSPRLKRQPALGLLNTRNKLANQHPHESMHLPLVKVVIPDQEMQEVHSH